MTDYYSISNIPWNSASIKSVKINSGVTAVGSMAFCNCSNLTDVTIADSVTSIGNNAFSSCVSLTDVIIGSSVSRIGFAAFGGCPSLESVSIPSGVTKIDSNAFSGCFKLAHVYYGGTANMWKHIKIGVNNVPLSTARVHYGTDTHIASGRCGENITWSLDSDTLTLSGSGATYDYTYPNLRPWEECSGFICQVLVGSGITGLGTGLFNSLENLASVKLPASLKSIGDFGFANCTRLKKITLPGKLEKIGKQSFFGLWSLETIIIPSGVKIIPDAAFAGCSSLNSVTFSEGLESIGEYAFCGDTCLESLVFPESLTEIKTGAFTDCEAIESVTIRKALKTIGDAVLYGCYSIKDVFFDGSKEEWEGISVGENNDALYAAKLHFGSAPAEISAFLTFSSDNSFTISMPKNWDGKLLYSTDAAAWNEWDGSKIGAVQKAAGEKYCLYFCGEGNSVITGFGTGLNSGFKITGSNVSCSGNIETLLDHGTVEAGNHPAMGKYCFYRLFYSCAVLTSTPTLPATTLVQGCYYDMFCGCKSLKTAPELPAMTLADSCYQSMFQACTSLTDAPALPAMTLADSCYSSMFTNCYALTGAPELPAMTLAQRCYANMFDHCTAMTRAPELPATTLAQNCYASMFIGCKALTSAPALPATKLAFWCYQSMFGGCTSLTNVPVLPATTLVANCYSGMFSGCTGIKLSETGNGKSWGIPAGATKAPNWNSSMFSGTGGSFTGDPEIGKTYYYELPAETLTLPAALKKIEAEAFTGIPAKVIVVPATVTGIGSRAFANCPNLRQIIFLGYPENIDIADDYLQGCGEVQIVKPET